MAIVTTDEVLEFIGVDRGYFEIAAGNDVLVLTKDAGSATNVDIADGTYSGDGLAAAIETAIDTAFTVTSTVSWSSSTRLFSMTAGAGTTLTFTLSGSDAALTIGFTADKAAALTLTSDLAAGDPTTVVGYIKDGVETWVQNSLLRRTLDSTAYSLKRYDGTGRKVIWLDDYPVTVFTKLAIGTRTAIRIKNTTANSTASVSVTSSGLALELDGTVDSDLVFATYTTITTLVAAVNALGSGWTAEVVGSYGSFKSTELLEAWGQNCIDSATVDIDMADEAENEFQLDPTTGKLTSYRLFNCGIRNIICSYTAGYSSSTMPDDIRFAVMALIQSMYRKRQDETFGLTQMRAGDISAAYAQLPPETKMIFDAYKRRMV